MDAFYEQDEQIFGQAVDPHHRVDVRSSSRSLTVRLRRVAPVAWIYPEALPESARLAGYISFDLDPLEVSVDGERLLSAAHQRVVATGSDRDLAVPVP